MKKKIFSFLNYRIYSFVDLVTRRIDSAAEQKEADYCGC